MVAEAALDQKLGTPLRLHEAAFQQIGGVQEEIFYDRMKTVWLGTDERGEIVWHPVFLDFARYGASRRACVGPYRAQTKGKVAAGVKYVTPEFSVWLARARTQQPERSECAAARVDLECSEPARARNHA
jgi:transposase